MEQKNSLIIRIVSMLGGVMTAGFFLVLLILVEAIGNTTSNLVTSTILMAVAIALSQCTSRSFPDAINATFYIAGCTILLVTDANTSGEPKMILMIASLLTFFFAKGFLLPFMAVVSFNTSLLAQVAHFLPDSILLPVAVVPIIIVFVLLNRLEEKHPEYTSSATYLKYPSLHSGFFVSGILALAGLSIGGFGSWTPSPFFWICVLYIVSRIMKVMNVENAVTECTAYLMSILLCIPTLYAPYLSGSLLLILVCFYYGYKKEFATSILLFIYSVSKFYYDLSQTLLVKSLLLFFSGIVFIAAWYLLTQKKNKA